MTALDAYDRLEAVGILKRSGEDDGTEVVVTFGEATLTMNALGEAGDTPISHWSLAAIDLLNETEQRAVYSLNAMSEETLEIEDLTLRHALEKVLQDRSGKPYRRKTPRSKLLLTATIAILAGGYFLLPGLVERTAKGMISPERAEILAAEMIPMIEERTGPACETPMAKVGLDRLAQRLNPDGKTRLFVHDLGDADVVSLPGGKILISQNVLENATDNLEIAAWAAIGIAGVIESPAISELFNGQGVMDGIKFLSSGQLPTAAKERAVNRILINTSEVSPVIAENAEQLLTNAQIPTTGLMRVLGKTAPAGEMKIQTPIMTDTQWSALRSVCKG